jgi:pyrroline-5-carboxylate reductase
MEASVAASIAVIRAMPNTPSVIKLGVTGIAAGKRANTEQVALAENLFAKVGKTLVVDESQIDALSTISGSGPAYVFYFIEQLVEAAKRLGFDDASAALLVNETFRGASEYLIASGREPGELRAQVTSPNGTTMRAIAELEKLNLAAGFEVALNAALARARELGAN